MLPHKDRIASGDVVAARFLNAQVRNSEGGSVPSCRFNAQMGQLQTAVDNALPLARDQAVRQMRLGWPPAVPDGRRLVISVRCAFRLGPDGRTATGLGQPCTAGNHDRRDSCRGGMSSSQEAVGIRQLILDGRSRLRENLSDESAPCPPRQSWSSGVEPIRIDGRSPRTPRTGHHLPACRRSMGAGIKAMADRAPPHRSCAPRAAEMH